MDLADLPPLHRALIMLDFDGTLVELAATPDAIAIPDDLSDMLSALDHSSLGLTLISGRTVKELTDFLPGYTGDIYGSHGSEWRVEGNMGTSVRLPGDLRDMMWRKADTIAANLSDAVFAERKPAGVVLHYRQAPQLHAAVERDVNALAEDLDGFEVHSAKMAVELRPCGRSKADAARTVITNSARGIPVFAGDDLTDEDAMSVVNAAGGITVKIGNGSSRATHRLLKPEELRTCLENWIKGGTA